MEQGGREPSDWNGFIEDLTDVDSLTTKADDLYPAGLLFLLGDGLADEELSVLFRDLLDNTGGALRSIATAQGMRGSSEDIARGLGRAHMLQLILRLADTDIVRVCLINLFGTSALPFHPGRCAARRSTPDNCMVAGD